MSENLEYNPFMTKYENWAMQEENLRKSIEDVIKEHIPAGSMHEFKNKPQAFVLKRANGGWGQTDTIFIDFLEGIEHRVLDLETDEGELVYHTITGGENGDKDECSGTDFLPGQLIEFLKQIEIDDYEIKLSKISAVLRKCGGVLECDGDFGFHATIDESGQNKHEVCGELSYIKTFILNEMDNSFTMTCICGGEYVVESDCQIPFDEIDAVVEYAINYAKTCIYLDEDQKKAVNDFTAAYYSLLHKCVGVVHVVDDHSLRFFNGRKTNGSSAIPKHTYNKTIYVNVQSQLDRISADGYKVGLGEWVLSAKNKDLYVKPIEQN